MMSPTGDVHQIGGNVDVGQGAIDLGVFSRRTRIINKVTATLEVRIERCQAGRSCNRIKRK